jgi:hypothetical protein
MSGERPDITHPDNHAAYVEQCRFVLFWFDQMFKRVASHNAKSALEARDALQTLLIHGVYELLGLVRGDKDSSAAQWAAKLLAAVAHEAELCETNEVYRQEKATLGKLFRTDVWFPKSPLYQAIHRELWFLPVVPSRTHLADGSAVFTKPKREATKGVFALNEAAEIVAEDLAKVGKTPVARGQDEQS